MTTIETYYSLWCDDCCAPVGEFEEESAAETARDKHERHHGEEEGDE